MKTYKIFFNELSPVCENGERRAIRHDLIGTFPTIGSASLILKLLNDSAYKNLVNKDKAAKNDYMKFLSLE